MVLAGILSAGFLVVWAVISLWAVQVGEHVWGSPRNAVLIFLPDGTPRVMYISDDNAREYRDLEGNAVPAPKEIHGGLSAAHLPAAWPGPASAGDTSPDQRIRSFTDGGAAPVFWYFLSDGASDAKAYFVGYDSKTKACVGYLGAAGFRTDPLPPDEQLPFVGPASGEGARVFCSQVSGSPVAHPMDQMAWQALPGCASPWDVYVFAPEGKIYHADLQGRTLSVALDDRHLRSGAMLLGLPNPTLGVPFRLVARVDAAVLVLDGLGQVLKQYPIPETLRDKDLNFAETSNGEALVYWHSPLDGLATQVEYRFYWVSQGGDYQEANVTLPWTSEMRAQQIFTGVEMPAPLVAICAVAMSRPTQLLEEGLALTYREALGRALIEFGPSLLFAQLLAAGLALLCYRRQVRYAARGPERVAWTLFVLAFGLPGWIGYRFGQSWPALQTCPECAMAVPRDREDCARCAAEFARPALKGTEVFA